jgi:hypothetical protein
MIKGASQDLAASKKIRDDVSYIKSQIYFFEDAVEGYRDRSESCVLEQKSHQAHVAESFVPVSASLPGVELTPLAAVRDVNHQPDDQPDEESHPGDCRQASHEQDAEEDR